MLNGRKRPSEQSLINRLMGTIQTSHSAQLNRKANLIVELQNGSESSMTQKDRLSSSSSVFLIL